VGGAFFGPIGSAIGSQIGGSILPGGVGAQPYARGGYIRGPGTGTSDEVEAVNGDNGQPIRLSNGEYVLPQKTVKALGIDKIDRIVEKTNGKPPVHKQYDRRGQPRKKALSR
jgi:hypothetical protein